jgi:prepilin-type processing-associated H-X9-DG protein
VRISVRIGAALAATALTVTACSTTSAGRGAGSTAGSGIPEHSRAAQTPTGVAEPSVSPTTSVPPMSLPTGLEPLPAPVHVSLLESDGATYGVGMPIIAWFNRAPTDLAAFDKAVTVTVNGRPAGGAWFWEKFGHAGAAVEAHYRPQHYWPAHAKIRMDAPLTGATPGSGLAYDDSLTLSVSTGAANIAMVDGHTERMTVTSDGKKVFSFPVSLGAADHPTYGGTKIVMEKDRVEEMKSSPGEPFYDLNVPWSVLLTNSGEFVHSASWNGGNIGVRSTSHGCTNLNVNAAEQYFRFAQVGDVFTHQHRRPHDAVLGRLRRLERAVVDLADRWPAVITAVPNLPASAVTHRAETAVTIEHGGIA